MNILVKILSERTESDRQALLKLLRNVHSTSTTSLVGPSMSLKISAETKDNLRQLLLRQPLGIVTREDIDTLYEAIAKGELFSG